MIKDDQALIGFHGTSQECANSIFRTGFIPSENPDEWLGYGVYFFTYGISDPVENAKEWAINKAWDNKERRNLYNIYAVLSAHVNGGNILNTSNSDHIKAFNDVRTALLKTHKKNWKSTRNIIEDNRIIWNLIAELMELDIIIHDLYVKTKFERIYKVSSNVPNVTVMCVKNVNNINFDTLKTVKEGLL